MQKRAIIRRSTILPTEVMAPYWPATLDLIAADLSPRGMYLISDDMPTVGEFVFCTFTLKLGEPAYRLLSRVNRINWHRRKTERVRPGFGVEFVGLAEDLYQRISKALIGMPPPIPTAKRKRLVDGYVLPHRPLEHHMLVPKPSTPRPTVPKPSAAGLVIPRPTAAMTRPSLPRPTLVIPPLPEPTIISARSIPVVPRPTIPTLPFPLGIPNITV